MRHPNPNRRPPRVLADLKARGLPSDFPLTPHACGQWRARIAGRDFYFGSIEDPEAARKQFDYEYEYLAKGMPIPDPDKGDRETLGGVLERWMEYQRGRLEAGGITPKTYDDYRRVAEFLEDKLGKTMRVDSIGPEQWTTLRVDIDKLTKSPTVASRYVTIAKMPWRWAWESAIIQNPMRFGPAFKVAPKSAVRKTRHAKRQRSFTADQVKALVDAAGQPMRAMVLLGINSGMTQVEVSGLVWDDVDLSAGLIDTLRAKTAVKRVAPLWPATVKALGELPRHKSRANVFTTRHGNDYVRQHVNDAGVLVARDGIAREFLKTVKAAGLDIPAGLGFGKLRATFRTAADGCRDTNASKRIMGHELGVGSVEEHYIDGISLERLQAVTDHVHSWLFGRKPRRRKGGGRG